MKQIPLLNTKEAQWNALDHAVTTMATCAMKAQFLTGDFKTEFKNMRRDKQQYVLELAQQYILAASIVEKMGFPGVHEAMLLVTRRAALLFNLIATESNKTYAQSEPIRAAMQLLQAYATSGAQEGPQAPPPAAQETGTQPGQDTGPNCAQGVHVFRDDGTCYGCGVKVEPPPPGYAADDLDLQQPAQTHDPDECPHPLYDCAGCWPEGKPS